MPDIRPLDLTNLLETCGGDESFISEVLEAYADQSAGLVSQIEAALAASDATALKDTAHTLKGSSRTVGANRVGLCCEEIERHAKAGSFGQAAEIFDRLREEMGSVLDDIQNRRADAAA